LINETVENGARKYKACEELGISVRTCQRWTEAGEVKCDGRAGAMRSTPRNQLSSEERARVLEVINSENFKDLPPSQIVPALADKGQYIASQSSFYRIMHEHKQQHHRGRSKAPQNRPLSTHKATAPNQVWCWDITWLPGPGRGMYYYLYLILDIYSRKVVGWEVHEQESSDNASQLVSRAHLRESVGDKPLVLHSDNGSPMKGASLLTTLYKLNIASSYSRPRVSNDNAYAESIFRTCKYRPDYPYKGFAGITEARQWVLKFVHWYNHTHKHSGIKFISPAQLHAGMDDEIMHQRKNVYAAAKAKHPGRWSRNTRNRELPSAVYLNPEKEKVVLTKTG